jgi:hypothetical protein
MFFLFSAIVLQRIFYYFPQYTDFLRFRISGVNLKALKFLTLFYIAIACFVTYLVLAVTVEIKKRTENYVKPLIYWFITTLAGFGGSIIILILYTGLDYQKSCVWNDWLKTTVASDYCYSVGETIFRQWAIMPGITILAAELVFMFLYFSKLKNDVV